MKKLYLSLIRGDETVSWPLLLISFLAGFIAAYTILHFFGGAVRGIMNFLL